MRQKADRARAVDGKESAKMQDAYLPDYTKQMPRPDHKTLPPERLESLGEIALQNRDYDSPCS